MKNLHSLCADILPDRQFGVIRGNKYPVPWEGPAAPDDTMVTDCKSKVCKARLLCVLGEVQKSNQAIRGLISGIEEERISAARHILHLKTIRQYQIAKKKNVLTSEDIEKLYEEGPVMENPDVQMDDTPIAGPSTNQSLTSQSLSYNGFSDSDSDYVP